MGNQNIKPISNDNQKRLSALIIPALGGKSTLCQKIISSNNQKRFIDLDEYISSQFDISNLQFKDEKTRELILFQPLRNSINEQLDLWKDQELILVTANLNFIKFLEISEDRRLILIPEEKLIESSLNNYKKQLKEFPEKNKILNFEYDQIINSRRKLIDSGENYEIFQSWKELEEKVIKKFKS